jgi:hypothetical protein
MASTRPKSVALDEDRDQLNREFREKFPRLASFGLPGPWDEKDDIWLEHMTGEPQGRRRASRDSDL